MTNRSRRLIAGAFAAAAVAAPLYAAITTTDASPQITAQPCLAWFGNKEDGKCLSYSNGNGMNVGTPDLGVYGPSSGAVGRGGIGVTTGSLLPGQSWNSPVG